MNNTPTPRTDFAIKASNGQWSYVLKLCAEELERELTAVTEQLKAAQDGWHDEITKGLTELRRAESIYTKAQERAEKAEEQRDRLAEVIEAASVLIAAKGRHNTMLAYNGLREALQSLNQPTP